jgi:sterol desaturase/sphingolipid hydroxylase (fatty acid hydroxylase superfamily)
MYFQVSSGQFPKTGCEVLLYEAACLLRAPFLMAAFCYLAWPIWDYIVSSAALPNDDLSFFTVTSVAVHAGAWLFFNGLFMGLGDCCGWFAAYKLPRTKRMLPKPSLVRSTIIDAAVKQLLSTPLLIYYLMPVLFPHNIPEQAPAGGRPSLLYMYLIFLLCTLWNAWAFFAAHWLMHAVPFLYRCIHKKHHQYVGSVSVAAEHAHPVEDALTAFVPTLGVALYFRIPTFCWLVWLLVRAEETYESHSGYCFANTWLARIGLLNSVRAAHHDLHHTKNTGNYGFVMQDWACGTLIADNEGT